jgi:hypothetical protein
MRSKGESAVERNDHQPASHPVGKVCQTGNVVAQQDRNGADRKVEDWSKFQLAGHFLGLADGLENPIGQPGAGPNVVIDKQQFAAQAAHGEPALVEVFNPLGVDEPRPEQLHHRVHELGLAVVTAAKQDRDDGKVSARLDNIADQLVPVPDQHLWLLGGTKDPTKGPVVFWATRTRVIGNIEAMPQK